MVECYTNSMHESDIAFKHILIFKIWATFQKFYMWQYIYMQKAFILLKTSNVYLWNYILYLIYYWKLHSVFQYKFSQTEKNKKCLLIKNFCPDCILC